MIPSSSCYTLTRQSLGKNRNVAPKKVAVIDKDFKCEKHNPIAQKTKKLETKIQKKILDKRRFLVQGYFTVLGNINNLIMVIMLITQNGKITWNKKTYLNFQTTFLIREAAIKKFLY